MKNNEGVVSVRLPKIMKERIDETVKDGLFMNQSDFIRTAIRKQLSSMGRWRKLE